MVRVKGTRGFVDVSIEGIAQIRKNIEAAEKKILSNLDIGLLRGTNFMQNEVQENIIGNRVETRSVASGKLANNINVRKVKDLVFEVFVNSVAYPGVTTTTVDVGKFLEFGTTRITPRRHFRNTFARNAKKAEEVVRDTIKF